MAAVALLSETPKTADVDIDGALAGTPGIETSRRSFLIGSAVVAGGLMVGLRPVSAKPASENALNGYIQIGSDNKVTILSSQWRAGRAVDRSGRGQRHCGRRRKPNPGAADVEIAGRLSVDN